MSDRDGLVGNIYGITVLPENMDEWIDEIYKRKVPIEEAKEVANWLIDQVSTRRAAEAQLEILRGFRRRDFTLDSFYEAAVIDQIARLQPTKGSK